MSKETAIQKTNGGKQVAPFGARTDIREIAERLRLTVPGGKKLAPEEATALAQISVAHGLDPFNGEAWFIPGSGVMVGIKGLRKAARKQLRKEHGEGANFWTTFERVPDPKEYQAGDEDIVYECHLRDDASLESWAVIVERFKSLGFQLDEATKHAGPAPVMVGVGIYKKGEHTKMQPNEVARKRAEANAIKQRFDVDFAFDVDTEHDYNVTIDAEYVEAPQERTAEEAIKELGFEGKDAEPPKIGKKEYRALVDKLGISDEEATGVYNECGKDFEQAYTHIQNTYAEQLELIAAQE